MDVVSLLGMENHKLKERIKELEAALQKERDFGLHIARCADHDIAKLTSDNARLKATISKMENVDERREYAYEMDIVIRWLDKNEDFVTEPNGKMQLLKSKAMHQKIKWLDEHPRTQTTEDSSATEKDG